MRLLFTTRVAAVVWLVAEVALVVLLVRWLGWWPVFWLMVATGFVGGWLIKREGVRAWSAVNAAIRSGRAPDRDLSSSRALITGGILLALPGFVTDILGLLMVIPATRGMVRRLWSALVPSMPGLHDGRPRGGGAGGGHSGGSASDLPGGGVVIEGEIVEPADESGAGGPTAGGPTAGGSPAGDSNPPRDSA